MMKNISAVLPRKGAFLEINSLNIISREYLEIHYEHN